ncbi:hypothetical protein MUN81_22585 (plasmid) [Hymenobacter sp. 5317J-9]|uniref:hypothetical protein n=1 Tax=unclassified Hymenobacter TaxID=2615202 RepID=UPI0018ECE5DA|nr:MULTISPECIES: hypothetical protein [unclassified Hymenobacter]MBJ6111830.1 hypothetical protein [Hymenobacter sp. BT523]UOR00194.1 hypothetical protein MUN81_22585 [Hymenobacter sp. 5317J-9]
MKIAAFTFLLIAASFQGKAQMAAYLCSQTGAYGYCYGNNDVANCAYQRCQSMGGTSPYSIYSTGSKGYGAIAIGQTAAGVRTVGASGGYSNATDAQTRAKNECLERGGQGVYIAHTWYDK